MSLRDTLTNEKLNDQYKNSFSLVNHAIGVAKHRIALGEGMDSHLATDILEKIAKGEPAGEEQIPAIDGDPILEPQEEVV